jgi:hypothetical protein
VRPLGLPAAHATPNADNGNHTNPEAEPHIVTLATLWDGQVIA